MKTRSTIRELKQECKTAEKELRDLVKESQRLQILTDELEAEIKNILQAIRRRREETKGGRK